MLRRTWFLCVLAWSSVASGADVAIVGVHDAALDLEAQTGLVESLRAAVESGGRHHALTAREVAAALAGREQLILREAVLADGRRLLEDGRILYQQAQPEAALDVLEAAVSELAEGVATTASVRDLWEAWMLLGTARLDLGREAAARDAVAVAVALQPERLPDPARFPPSVIDLHRFEHDLAADELAAIDVKLPEGVEAATVMVDGRDVGPAPLVVDVFPGQHHVHLRTDGGRVGYRLVEVGSGEEKPLTVALGPATLGSARTSTGGRTQQIAQLYRTLARNMGVDLVVIAGEVDGVAQLQLFDPVVDAFGEPETAGTDPTALVAAMARALGGVRGGRLSSDKVYVALPLDLSSNVLLAGLLRTPEQLSVPLPSMGPVDPLDPDGPTPAPRKRLSTPAIIGIGVGGAVLVAGVTTLAVLLSRGEQAPISDGTGTIVIGPPAR